MDFRRRRWCRHRSIILPLFTEAYFYMCLLRNQVLLLPIIASDEPSIIASVEPPIIATVAVSAAAAQKQPEKTLQISSSISP
ncbi:hypothetical protein L6452_22948 [Arctium lappa]|uniref:Uncharacterized protein n=1 Tax=Arctium lappa TaxID=4217 RepID=A0ACB9B0S9_ARCLA|nr:hypothetical protein L6452_22948 [Arctium lappa]